jgi:hypothetical protein
MYCESNQPSVVEWTSDWGWQRAIDCTLQVAKNESSVLRGLAAVVTKSPDIIEWRVVQEILQRRLVSK